VVAGVFVDRFGFRKTLAACFTLFTAGYFLIGLAGMPAGQGMVNALGKSGYMLAVLVLTAAGGSLIKPCIVGTVERTSREEYRSLGFSIYYSLVNLGGAVGPVLASSVRTSYGIAFVFMVSAGTSALMLASTLLLFREPARQEGVVQRSFGALFRDMALVFRNVRFRSFLVIFSGFWIMFWQVFYSFPFYVDEILHFQRFEILETVDAWTIIVLSVPITALAKRMAPISAMSLGFFIASASWLVIAAVPTIAGAIAALFLFAIGESLQAPRYYDYVGRLAPRHQVGTFMGFAFLPIAIGSFIAGRLGTWLVQQYMRDTHRPAMMWVVVAGIGFASTLGMLLYNRFVAREPEPPSA
jgi:MFS family permease